MFCTRCGKEIPENSICPCQQTDQKSSQGKQQTPINRSGTDNSKIYSILAYIGILWVVGAVVVPEKDNEDVRFHVGQGMLLFICYFIASAALRIVKSISFAIFTSFFESAVNIILSIGVWGIFFALAINGIVNANSNKRVPLPIIGQFAFYK